MKKFLISLLFVLPLLAFLFAPTDAVSQPGSTGSPGGPCLTCSSSNGCCSTNGGLDPGGMCSYNVICTRWYHLIGGDICAAWTCTSCSTFGTCTGGNPPI